MITTNSFRQRNRSYLIRIQLAVIATLVLFIALFRFCPVMFDSERELDGRFDEERPLGFEYVETMQEVSALRSAPQVQRPRAALPHEEVVDMEYNLDLGDITREGVPLAPFEEEETEVELVEEPDSRPVVRRIVEPVMPSDARRDNLYIEVEVLFIVSENGRVEEASIYEMRLLNRNTGRLEQVAETGYGFREIVLNAARQWEFQPARHRGEPVRSPTRHLFRFGSR
ncbi:hypothetical protein QA596_06880 [Balneolales bacterium ANBcel1]|nr:hypothetical protein [Balneolales bacterium ANBcel1]